MAARTEWLQRILNRTGMVYRNDEKLIIFPFRMVSKNVQVLFGECIGIFLFLTVALGKSYFLETSGNLILYQT